MHIVFATVELATANNASGGLASFTANMARIFAENGHKVTVLVAATKDEKLKFDENIAVETTYIKKSVWDAFDRAAKFLAFGGNKKSLDLRKFFISVYKSRQVRKKIQEINRVEKIDIVHYCDWNALAYRADKKIPFVVRVSSFMNIWEGANLPEGNIEYAKNKLSIRDKWIVYVLKKSRYIIFPSKLLAEIGKKELGLNVTVIESPFRLDTKDWDYSLYQSNGAGKRYIIHYGNMRYFKGTHIVALTVKKILEKYPDIYLFLVGRSEALLDEKGEKVRADELIKKNAGEFSDRVIYMGSLPREQLYPFIQNAEICFLPSRIENLSNACIEAMAMGKIVVATNGASYEQLIDDRVSGFLCERDNPESFLKAIYEALNMSKEEKDKMILKASERIKLLNPDTIYRKYFNYYNKVIKEWYR